MRSISRPSDRCRAIAIRWLASTFLIVATAREGMASYLSISAPNPVLAPGESETISVLLTSTEAFNLQSASLVLTFDSTRFSSPSATQGSLFFGSSSGGSGTVTRSFNGISDIFTLNGAGTPISAGQVGSLVVFTLRALDNAPAGPSTIDLKAVFNLTGTPITTQLNGGAIILNPAPTNDFDAGIDAIITVSAVPEPGSVVLLGLGAGLAPLIAARRRRAGRRAA